MTYISRSSDFCLISWRLFDVCTWYIGSVNQYDLTFDLKINVGHCDLYSMVQWFCLIIIWDYESYWPKVWPQNKYRSLWFCVTSWRLFDVLTSSFGIMGQYDLKINAGLCDLYFMVLWFSLISPILFDAWVSYFQKMRQCDPNFDLKVNITWPILHGLVILLNIFKSIWWMNIIVGIMDQCDT